MSVLVYIEIADGAIKKSSLEAVSFAKAISNDVFAIYIGNTNGLNLASLGTYGVNKVFHVTNTELANPNVQAYTSAVKDVVDTCGADNVVFAKSSFADPIAARLSIKLGADIITNISELPKGGTFKRSIFTGKGFANVESSGNKKVMVLKKNAANILETNGTATIETINVQIKQNDFVIKQKEVQKASGQVLLPEAEIVVSGGRGLKGPENWGIIEDLAKTLGAATGCSKPVSDLDWRPHHEHVGQTGVKVSPNLYIAVGISGAIQHLAGVNSSKCIVVINKDPEAPFFKAADYGIVGDAFEILPKLNEAFKKSL